jgi:hypothetical protein
MAPQGPNKKIDEKESEAKKVKEAHQIIMDQFAELDAHN